MAKGYHPDEGGMQTYAEGVADAYAASGAAVTIFTQTSAGPRDFTAGAVRVIDIGPGGGAGVPVRFWRAMRQELRVTGAPLFTHGTTWRTSVLPMVLRLPYVTTFHGREFMYARGAMLALMRLVARRAQRCFAVSHYSAHKLMGRLAPLAIVPLVAWNGLSAWNRPERSPQNENQAPLIASLCRLEPRKNIIACVRACAVLRDKGYDFRYLIAGRGPDLEEIRTAVESYGLEDSVEVAGFVSAERAAQLYADADIFLHPQVAADDGRDFEGFGIAIGDAMAAGAAVIVGEQGGAKELVVEGISGLIVDGSDNDAIVHALERLLTDKQSSQKMGEAGQRRAHEYFTWQRHIAVILSAIDLKD